VLHISDLLKQRSKQNKTHNPEFLCLEMGHFQLSFQMIFHSNLPAGGESVRHPVHIRENMGQPYTHESNTKPYQRPFRVLLSNEWGRV
jgi:hypothetical protein